MRAHQAAGRAGAALSAYARMQARLREDLGADPDPETVRLHAAVLAGRRDDETAPAAEPGPVLVGREGEFDALDDALARSRDRGAVVVLVTGEPGIGKTQLARAWAARARERGAVVLSARAEAGAGLQPLADVVARRRRSPLWMRTPRWSGSCSGPRRRPGRGLGGPARAWCPGRDRAAPGVRRHGAAARPAWPLLQASPSSSTTSTPRRRRCAAGSSTSRTTPKSTDSSRSGCGAASTRRRSGDAPDRGAATRRGCGRGPGGCGPGRALWRRSGGNPLLLSELAAADDDERAAVPARAGGATADDAGAAAPTLRAAAVLGAGVDLDLLARVVERSPSEVLDDLEQGIRLALVVEDRDGLRVPARDPPRGDRGRDDRRPGSPGSTAGRPSCWPSGRTPTRSSWPGTRGWAATRGWWRAAWLDAAELARRRFDLTGAEALLGEALAAEDELGRRGSGAAGSGWRGGTSPAPTRTPSRRWAPGPARGPRAAGVGGPQPARHGRRHPAGPGRREPGDRTRTEGRAACWPWRSRTAAPATCGPPTACWRRRCAAGRRGRPAWPPGRGYCGPTRADPARRWPRWSHCSGPTPAACTRSGWSTCCR